MSDTERTSERWRNDSWWRRPWWQRLALTLAALVAGQVFAALVLWVVDHA